MDLELEAQEPPQFLYHGTASRYLGSIMAGGLKPMSRLYVHLSKDIETALQYKDGQPFYLSKNGVWLVEKVDTNYIERIPMP